MTHFWIAFLSWVGSLSKNRCNCSVAIVNSSIDIVSLCLSPPQKDGFLQDRDTFGLCVSALSIEPGTHSSLNGVHLTEGNCQFDLEGN